MKSEMLTVREIAAYLRISLPSAYKFVNSGAVPHVRIGQRYAVPRADFEAWLSENMKGGASRV